MFAILLSSIKSQLPGLLIGAVSGVCVTLWAGISSRVFRNIDRVAKHRLQVAQKVHEICAEASSSNYTKLPRDREHVISVIANVRGFDEELGDIFEWFLINWEAMHVLSGKKIINEEEENLYYSLLEKLESGHDTLLKWANQSRAPHGLLNVIQNALSPS